MTTDSEALPVKVEVAARAEAKLEIQARVPEQSMGRLVDALTDLIRPFSESRGLRADQIRLQREEVALETAIRARERLRLEGTQVREVPNKVLIPLIEAASNEDPSDESMIERWANLLASASSNRNVEPRFIGILRELQGRQAEVFEVVALNNSEEFERPLAHLEDSPVLLEPASLHQWLNDYFRRQGDRPDVADMYAVILDWLERPGSFVVDILAHFKNDMWSNDAAAQSNAISEFDLEILASLGLVRRVNHFYRSRFGYELQIIYYHFTELGVRFFFACKNTGPEELVLDS